LIIPVSFSPLQWKREIDSKVTLPNGKPLPVVLLANKCDLPEAVVRREMLDDFCKEHGFTAWYETSAKNNVNIEESVRGLVAAILSHPDAFEAQRVLAANKALAPGGVALAGAGGGAAAGAGSSDAGGKTSGGGCCGS
jgi:Ras-related protein Rab-32